MAAGREMLRDALIVALGFALVANTRRARQRRSPQYANVGLTDDLRDRFLATVSHELRTPLNAIVGWAQLLKSGGLKPTQMSDAIDAIDRNARLEARMIDDLLDVSRMRRGRVLISRTPIELQGVVDDVISAMRSTAEAKGLSLSCEQSGRSIHILGDEIRLRQLIGHLIANSMKFTGAGGRINIRVADEEGFAVLRVHDNGAGIAPDDLRHVLEPFYQGTSRATRRGLGLGLALVAELVELHGGTIEIESKGAGAGTVVVVRLPTTSAPS